jgi:putative peptidoglycan lipid II flippase
MDLPLGIVGVAFGTVLLPTFAGFFAKGDLGGARGALSSSLRGLMLVMLPSAAGLFVLAPEITSVIYEGNAFDATATLRVSRSVAVYAMGLGFFGFQKSLVPWFQAQNDMKTPLRVSLFTVIMNAALNILAVALLPEEWRHVGLAVSTVVCAGAGCMMLAVLARRKNGALGLGVIAGDLIWIAISSLTMGFAVWKAKALFTDVNAIVALAAQIVLGAAVYGALTFRMICQKKGIKP